MPRAWYFGERAQNAAKRFGAFLGAVFVLWLLSHISWVATSAHVVQGGVYSVAHSVAQFATRLFANEEDAMQRLAVCTDLLADQAARNAQLASAENEVAQWRQIFTYQRAHERNEVSARIIARGALASSDVLLDRGERDGIAVGDAVVIGSGFLLGTVVEIGETESRVRLIEDPQSAVTATIYGQEKTIGLVVGNEGAVLTLEYVPQQTVISVGDSVVTSGLGGNIPEGLLIGIIESVTTEESAPFVTATISPIHDPRTWNVVLVVRDAPLSL
jgi:rod shape-determining protein MreC